MHFFFLRRFASYVQLVLSSVRTQNEAKREIKRITECTHANTSPFDFLAQTTLTFLPRHSSPVMSGFVQSVWPRSKNSPAWSKCCLFLQCGVIYRRPTLMADVCLSVSTIQGSMKDRDARIEMLAEKTRRWKFRSTKSVKQPHPTMYSIWKHLVWTELVAAALSVKFAKEVLGFRFVYILVRNDWTHEWLLCKGLVRHLLESSRALTETMATKAQVLLWIMCSMFSMRSPEMLLLQQVLNLGSRLQDAKAGSVELAPSNCFDFMPLAPRGKSLHS